MKNLFNRFFCFFLGHVLLRATPDARYSTCVHCGKRVRTVEVLLED